MEYALHLPHPRRSLAIPLAAALLGAAAATTGYALIDGEEASPARVVIVESSGSDPQAERRPQLAGRRP